MSTTRQPNESSCSWPGNDALMQQYHDEEWGLPVHDDRRHFEFLVLDAFQAGLSWRTILHRREGFREAFAGFDPARVAKFSEADVDRLLQDTGIIRNRQKINATIGNARAFLAVQQAFGSFDAFIWTFVGGHTRINHYAPGEKAPATSAESDAMSKALIARGFRFVGSTICYAYMQAAGLVDDHAEDCNRKQRDGAEQGGEDLR